MKHLLLLWLGLLAGVAAHAAANPPDPQSPLPVLRVAGGGWGDAGPAQIEAVLDQVAAVLQPARGVRLGNPIVISHSELSPVTLYERGPGGEYLIRLHASGERWHLYVFEFAHEYCHLLSNYDAQVAADGVRRNQWFEESLCETASLYALVRLGGEWQRSPPAFVAPGQAGDLRRFFDLLIGEPHRRLPADARFAAWLNDNEPLLRRDPYQRQKNDLVALRLLPLFQGSPGGWEAVGYLNLEPADATASLAEYLAHWHAHAPVRDKAFVAGVMALFGAGGSRLSAAR